MIYVFIYLYENLNSTYLLSERLFIVLRTSSQKYM